MLFVPFTLYFLSREMLAKNTKNQKVKNCFMKLNKFKRTGTRHCN